MMTSPEQPTPSESSQAPSSTVAPDPQSSFRLEIAVSIGYQRRRATHVARWESGITSMVLLLGGVTVVLVILGWLSGLKLP